MKPDTFHFLYVDAMQSPSDWEFRPHRHSFHELLLITNGEMSVNTPLGTITARSRDLLFYGAGMLHDEKASKKHSVQTLFMAFQWDGDPSEIPLYTSDAMGRIRFLMHWLYEEEYRGSGLHRDIANAFTALIVHELVSLSSNTCPSLISRIRSFMRTNASSPLKLEDLAREAKMSKYHFVRSYKAMTGHTPAADLRTVRLDMARELLLTTDLPLKMIAPRIGLMDEYQLSRMLRKYLGTSASELRNRPRRIKESMKYP